jgi:hypothetical protein
MENMFEKLNKQSKTIKEGIVLENMEFKPLKDFIGSEIYVDGFFFTNGRFGTQVVVVGNGAKINMPARAVEQFESIADSKELTEAVLTGHLKLTDINLIKTKNGNTTSYTLTTIQ